MFIDSFMEDVAYVRDAEDFVQSMICYLPGCICYGSQNLGLGSLLDYYVGLTGATPQLYEGWNFNSGNYLFTTDTK